MTLAAIIVVTLACAVAASVLVRRGAIHAAVAVPLVLLPPLGGWLLMQSWSVPSRSPHTFEVLGQYHRLSDTVRIANRDDADVVVRRGTIADADVAVSFDAATAGMRVEVNRAAVPVLFGTRPVNALPLGRSASLTSAAGETRVVLRPWYCWRCDTRYVQDVDGGNRAEVRLDSSPRVVLGGDTVRLFRVGAAAYAAADPASGVQVNGATIPSLHVGAADTLRLGWPDGERLAVMPVPAQHRLHVLFADAAVQGWVLPRSETPARLLVSATTAEPLAGTLPVINPAAAAPGAAKQPYGGVLTAGTDGWSWNDGGRTIRFESDVAQLLPAPDRGRTAGHIVRIRQHDMDAGAARRAVTVAWLAGVLSFAWLWRHLHPHALALRLLLLGPLYALVFVRGTLAFRAWLAPPHDMNSPRTFIALLLALPALAAALHLWSLADRLDRRHLARESGVVAGLMIAAAAATAAIVLPGWRADLLITLAAAVMIPVGGLILVNRLLLHEGTASGPLAAVSTPAQESYTYRQFLSALVLLGVLGFLLLLISELLRLGTLVAIVAWGAIFGVTLLVTAGPRVLIRPRSQARPRVIGAAAGIAAGAVAWLLGLGTAISLAALVVGAATGWAVAARSSFRVRPVRLRDLAGPPLTLIVATSLAAVLVPGLLESVRVVAEYGLAMAGLITLARIFAILWFRHMQQAAHWRRPRRPSFPGMLSIGAVSLLAVIAVYLPMTAFDAGLVLLFFAATVTALFVAFYTMGARTVAVLMPVAVVAVFVAGMFVLPSTLREGSGSLRTAQIRYAATYHPAELQQHMLTTTNGRPVTTVRTLQQYWGVRHFAAGGMDGRGYFGAAYADWIVPRPVALTENVFSTFVLSEHGWYGGVAVLLAYLAVALALLYAAGRAAGRGGTAPRSLLLTGIAAFWLVPAFYIAAANGVLLPLTGQNMPMLGLLSSADVVLVCWLAALGLCALPLEGDSGVEHVRSEGWTRRLRSSVAMVAVGFVTAAVVLSVMLLGPIRAQIGDFSLDGVVAGVESLVEQGALHAVRTDSGADSVAVAASAAAHPYLAAGGFVRGGVRRANAIARGEATGAGCLDGDALVRVRSDGSVGTLAGLCSLRAVIERRQDWTGSLVADAGGHHYVVSDGRTSVVLDPMHEDDLVFGRGCGRAGTWRGRAVRLGCDADAPVLRYGTSAPVLESVGSLSVELNGASAATPALIRDGDHIRVSGVADLWIQQLPEGALSYARWENAGIRRIADERITPWLAQLDTQLARGLSHPDRGGWDVTLTLRPVLHAQLQAAIATACEAVPGARRCSAVLADPVTGEILAMTATESQPHRFLPADPNLRNHPAASAIKPVLAAAALYAYPQLGTLEVEHSASEYSTVANTAIAPSLRAEPRYPSSRVPMRGYIGASDNLYSATLGFIATSARGANNLPNMQGTADHSRLRVGGQPLRGRPSWASSSTMDLSGSPLATALGDLFGAHVHSARTPSYETAFWSEAVRHGVLIPSGDVQRITPEPVGLAMDGFRSPRELASFTIGGGRNRWNNVALVQAISRIYSGHGVNLHVVRAAGPHVISPQPRAFGLNAAARTSVLDGMDAVTQEPWGTGYALRNAFPARVSWRAKTGTLNEREWVGSIFLFAGGPAGTQANVCAAAGIVTVELATGAAADGRATALFRDAVAPLLRRQLGWGPDAAAGRGNAAAVCGQ
ncbi:hypothetical protein BH23GEM9_BH23GEM9_17480 [soil metagenome]